jgi:hypothetical protein
MLARLWQQWPSALQQLRYSRGLGRTCPAYSTDQAANKKPYISQKVKFVDKLRVVARGGQGGGGSSALFGRTGEDSSSSSSAQIKTSGPLSKLSTARQQLVVAHGAHAQHQLAKVASQRVSGPPCCIMFVCCQVTTLVLLAAMVPQVVQLCFVQPAS